MFIKGLKPTNDLLIIRRIIEEEYRSSGGIVLPSTDESSDTPFKGVVVWAGEGKPVTLVGAGKELVQATKALADAYKSLLDSLPDHGMAHHISLSHWERAVEALENHETIPERIPMSVKVGDTVIFSRYGFQEFKINGETLIALGEASVLGVVE